MKRFRVSVGIALVGLLGSLTQVSHAGAVTQPAASATGVSERAVCGAAPVGYARCHAHVVTGGMPASGATSGPAGYHPSDLWAAYNLPHPTSVATFVPNGQTIAIVDAYDDPSAISDLAVYRRQFSLPLCSDGSAACIVKKVGQSATSPTPKANGGWAQEISLDLDMASAACPNCSILLVEAASSSFTDLGTAVDYASTLGAQAISNSYGGSEFSTEVTDTHYNHPGHAITVSSGDNGYGVEYPAASQYVTAVGGTSLNPDSGVARGWSETVWSGAGSGCSKYDPIQSWQSSAKVGASTLGSLSICNGFRNVADVSAVADPNTGVSVYDSFTYRGMSGWMVFGGTSVASPIIAGVYALAGNAATVTGGTGYGSFPYSHADSLHDVTSGSNGNCGTYLCNAGTAYDGPTGLGTPNGTGAF